jgi:hypothetical protein
VCVQAMGKISQLFHNKGLVFIHTLLRFPEIQTNATQHYPGDRIFSLKSQNKTLLTWSSASKIVAAWVFYLNYKNMTNILAVMHYFVLHTDIGLNREIVGKLSQGGIHKYRHKNNSAKFTFTVQAHRDSHIIPKYYNLVDPLKQLNS